MLKTFNVLIEKICRIIIEFYIFYDSIVRYSTILIIIKNSTILSGICFRGNEMTIEIFGHNWLCKIISLELHLTHDWKTWGNDWNGWWYSYLIIHECDTSFFSQLFWSHDISLLRITGTHYCIVIKLHKTPPFQNSLPLFDIFSNQIVI